MPREGAESRKMAYQRAAEANGGIGRRPASGHYNAPDMAGSLRLALLGQAAAYDGEAAVERALAHFDGPLPERGSGMDHVHRDQAEKECSGPGKARAFTSLT